MYNIGSFNKLRFNVSAEDDSDVRLIDTMYASFSGMVLTGGNLFVIQTANNSIDADAIMAAGVRLGPVVMIDSMNAASTGCIYCYLMQQLGGVFRSTFWCSQNVGIVAELSAMIQDASRVGVNKSIKLAMTAACEKAVSAAVDYYLSSLVMASIMDAQITSIIFDISYATLDITIKPGQTLVIDSDNFIVLLDGEDAIRAHSGVWPWLSRELFDLQVSSGAASDLDTAVLYTERYL